MTNFAQERFDIGVEAAYLLNEAREITQHSGPTIDEQWQLRSEETSGTDMSMKTLNRLYVDHEDAWKNYHIFKHIADTIFSSFVPDLTRDISEGEYREEVAYLMSEVNGFPKKVNYPFIEEAVS